MAATAAGRLVALVGDEGSIRLVDVAGGKTRRLDSDASGCGTPAFSSDGKTLAVSCQNAGRWEIRLFPITGGSYKAIPGASADMFPTFSSDDGRVYFLRATQVGNRFAIAGLSMSRFQIWFYDLRAKVARLLSPTVYLTASGLAVKKDRVAIAVAPLQDYEHERLIEFAIDGNALHIQWERVIEVSGLHYTSDGRLLGVHNAPGDSDDRGYFNYEINEIGRSGSPRPLTRMHTYIDSFSPVADGFIVLYSPDRNSSCKLAKIDASGRQKELTAPR